MSDSNDGDPDRDAILRRRNRLIAFALTGLVSGTTQACACLSIAAQDSGVDAGQPRADAGTSDDAGLSRDGGPLPCLSNIPEDGGRAEDGGSAQDGGSADDAGLSDAGSHDAGEPMPCLAPPPRE